jgi:hypothetical protein
MLMEFSSNQVAMQYIPCLLGCTAPAGPDGRSVLAPPHRLAKQLSATGSVTSTPSVESVIQVIGLLASILISID